MCECSTIQGLQSMYIYTYVLKRLLLLNGGAKSKSLNTMACPSQEGKTNIGREGASQSARPTGLCT